MFNAITRRLGRRAARADAGSRAGARARDARLQLSLPNPYGGAPWVTATLALSSVPRGQGETLRLRAHVDGCLQGAGRSCGTRVLPDAADRAPSLLHRGRGVAAALARGVLVRMPSRRLPDHRWRGWLDVQVSTAPLDAGADALMPEPLRRIYQGGLPRAGRGEPRIGVWAGPAGGAAGGIARLAVLQLDERDLGRTRSTHGSAGFNLSISLAQVVEPRPTDNDTDEWR